MPYLSQNGRGVFALNSTNSQRAAPVPLGGRDALAGLYGGKNGCDSYARRQGADPGDEGGDVMHLCSPFCLAYLCLCLCAPRLFGRRHNDMWDGRKSDPFSRYRNMLSNSTRGVLHIEYNISCVILPFKKIFLT